jgi:hypothetical protein
MYSFFKKRIVVGAGALGAITMGRRPPSNAIAASISGQSILSKSMKIMY